MLSAEADPVPQGATRAGSMAMHKGWRYTLNFGSYGHEGDDATERHDRAPDRGRAAGDDPPHEARRQACGSASSRISAVSARSRPRCAMGKGKGSAGILGRPG